MLLPLLLAHALGAQGVTSVEPYARPDNAVTVDAFGVYVLGVGVAYEARLSGHTALRGSVGVPGSVFGLQPGASVGGMALGFAGGRWVEAEAGAGMNVWVGGRSDRPYQPNLYGGVRASVPMGRDLTDGSTVQRDLLLRAGASVVWSSGWEDTWAPVVVPALSAGVAW